MVHLPILSRSEIIAMGMKVIPCERVILPQLSLWDECSPAVCVRCVRKEDEPLGCLKSISFAVSAFYERVEEVRFEHIFAIVLAAEHADVARFVTSTLEDVDLVRARFYSLENATRNVL
jgi:hypothetical protein